jgi:hypothetical protein
MGIQPIDFIKKWKAVALNESAATHSHFNELCSLLGEETPTDADHDGSWYCLSGVGGKIGSMYVVPLSSKGFAVLIRTMKKLDLKCRHPRSHCTDW